MARNENDDRIFAARTRRSANGFRLSRTFRKLFVGHCLTKWNARNLFPDFFLKCSSFRQNLEGKIGSFARKIFLKFFCARCKNLIVTGFFSSFPKIDVRDRMPVTCESEKAEGGGENEGGYEGSVLRSSPPAPLRCGEEG